MSYDDYAAMVPPGKLELKLDEQFHGVEKHLGKIADKMVDWDTKLAPYLDIKQREIDDIQVKFRDQPEHQRLVNHNWIARGGTRYSRGFFHFFSLGEHFCDRGRTSLVQKQLMAI